jgi:predicted double-glycine peptidase
MHVGRTDPSAANAPQAEPETAPPPAPPPPAAAPAPAGAATRADGMARLARVEVNGVDVDPKTPVPEVPTTVPDWTIPLPQFRQSDGETCGVDSLMSVMAYYGLGEDPNEKDLRKELHTTYKDGTEPPHIQQIAEKYGLNADVRSNMTVDDLAKLVNAGTPVMVTYQAYHDSTRKRDEIPGPDGGAKHALDLHNPDGSWNWKNDWIDGHYSVVIGVDKDFVYLQDPSNGQGRSVIPRQEFDERWHDTDQKWRPTYVHTGIVFKPKEKPAELHPVYVRDCQYVP